MYNVPKKYVERNLRAKNGASSKFEKSFFEQPISNIDCSKKLFSNLDEASFLARRLRSTYFFWHVIYMKNVY